MKCDAFRRMLNECPVEYVPGTHSQKTRRESSLLTKKTYHLNVQVRSGTLKSMENVHSSNPSRHSGCLTTSTSSISMYNVKQCLYAAQTTWPRVRDHLAARVALEAFHEDNDYELSLGIKLWDYLDVTSLHSDATRGFKKNVWRLPSQVLQVQFR